MLVMPAGGRVRIEQPGAPLEIETRAYRGTLEIFGNIRHPLTVAKLERFKGRYGLETQEAVKGSLEVATQILKAYKSGATLQILDQAGIVVEEWPTLEGLLRHLDRKHELEDE